MSCNENFVLVSKPQATTLRPRARKERVQIHDACGNAILTSSTPDSLDSHIPQGYQGEALTVRFCNLNWSYFSPRPSCQQNTAVAWRRAASASSQIRSDGAYPAPKCTASSAMKRLRGKHRT